MNKTEQISFVNGTLGMPDKLTCVSRARRFGKSVAVKMLSAYYDKSCDSRALFENLKIAGDPVFEKYLNQYDVIYLDITLFIAACENIKNVMDYLQEQVIQEIAAEYLSAAGEKLLPVALAKASEASGNKFTVIIDEWGALFRVIENLF
nr:AAA family ATPase [uncultured Acetatifactor sp.]